MRGRLSVLRGGYAERRPWIESQYDGRGGMGGKGEGEGGTDFLVIVVHVLVEFRMAHLAEHFCIDLRCVTISCIIIFPFKFLPFRLQ